MLTVHISIADSAAMPESKTLLTNVNVFNSRNDEPVKGMNAPVEGKKIKTIAKSILAPGAPRC